MKILSLDCAGGACVVAAWEDGAARALVREAMERGQDARLIPMVQEVLAQAGWCYEDLIRIVATKGPGSFTGLRIGLAAAQGIGLAAGKPVLGVNRFDVIAAQYKDASPLLIVLESRRAELYVRRVGDAADMMLEPEAIAAMLAADPALRVAGDGAARLEELAAPERFLPVPQEEEALTAAALAAAASPDDPAFAPRPYYLRAPDVTMAKAAAQLSGGCCS